MPRSLPLTLCLALSAACLSAQSTGIPPTPETAPRHPPAPADPAPTATPSGRTPTLTTNTRLVVVDVIVTDHAGRNVHGLQQSDFTLTEDGKPEPIRSFDEHTAPTQPVTAEPPLDLPPGVFTNYSPAPHSAALNILLFDSLNTPLLDQAYVRDQLLQFIRTASPTDRVAIFGLTTHLIYLQGFTSDPALLRAAIDTKSVRSSQLLNNAATGGDSHEFSRLLEAGHDPEIAGSIARVRELEAKSESFNVELRAHYTLDAMNALAHYLAQFPGRKNLIWFSGSFPINILPDGSLPDPFSVATDLNNEVKDTTSLLTGAQVAIYPIDARGLFNDPSYDPSQRGNPQNFNRDFAENSDRRLSEFSTMRTMAEQTGGHAFVNNNGFKEAVQTVLRTGANFYTLTYAPPAGKPDGRFRHISVRLQGQPAQQSLTLAYRRGYFALPPDPVTPARQTPTGNGRPGPPAPANSNVLRSAMLRGAPESTGIIFKAMVLPALPASTPAESAPSPATQVNSNPKIARGPWRRYTVAVVVAPGQLMARSPDGSYTGVAEFLVHCYNDDGALVSVVHQTASMALSAEDARRAAGTGIRTEQVISIPERGAYHLRVGVHSLLDNRVGSLEVPVATIKNLPPAASSTSAAAPPSPDAR